MSDRYERLHDADPPRVIARGHTLPELFENAALAMFSIAFEVEDIVPRHSRPVVAPGDDVPELLHNWLGELRAVSAEAGIAFSYFTVDRLEEGGVQGSAAGAPVGDVVRTDLVVRRASIAPTGIVEIPDGFWVEIEFDVEPRLRGI